MRLLLWPKKLLKVFAKNTNFIIFTFLTSFPCFMVYHGTFLDNLLVETFHTLKPPLGYLDYNWPIPFDIARKLDKSFLHQLIQLASLYLLPLPFLELSTVIVIVDLALKLYREGSIVTLKDIIKK